MAYTLSPNMSLVIPTVGSEAGPQYATDINNSLSIIDQHSHVVGSGVQITPAALNINSSLTMNSNPLTSIAYLTLDAQSVTPSNLTVFISGNDLHYIDGVGNDVQLTSGGAVNATSSGLSSGTATAAFSGGVLVVNSDTLTPANIQVGSLLIGNNVASSNYLTLAPPNSMGASYTVTLPPPNSLGATAIMTYDTSNNISGITIATLGASVGPNITNLANNAAVNTKNIVTSNTNNSNGLAIVRGIVNSTGTAVAGEGFSSVQTSTTTFNVSYNAGFGDNPAVIVTPQSGSSYFGSVNVFVLSSAGFSVNLGQTNVGFSFIAIGQHA